MAKTIRLTENDLQSIIRRIIIENNAATINQYRQIFVDSGKISEKDYNTIIETSDGKGAYIKWLCARVAKKIIKGEDISRFKDFFSTFEEIQKGNQTAKTFLHLPQFKEGEKYILNLDKIKTKEDISEVEIAIDNYKRKTKSLESDGGNNENLVSKGDLLKLDAAGIKLLGTVDGYQIFKIQDISKETHKVYCDVLFKHKEGADIKFCTFGFANYQEELVNHPGSAYYFIFNLADDMGPYQFHYESNQFMDRLDHQLF
jgi:hypothetical protein